MSQELLTKENLIEVYEPFFVELGKLKSKNDSVVFDYADKKGEKEARSHIYKLRQSKTAVDQFRKDKNADAVAFKKKNDEIAKGIICEVEKMIETHVKPLDEIKQAEANRVAAIQAKIDIIKRFQTATGSSEELKRLSASLFFDHDIDESFQEFEEYALDEQRKAAAHLGQAIEEAELREAKDAELEELRLKQAARDKADEEARLRAEGEAKAKAEAEAKDAQAQQQADQAAENERRRIAQEVALKKAEEAKRAANIEHQRKINKAALQSLSTELEKVKVDIDGDKLMSVLTLIAQRKVKHVSINY